MQSQKWKNKNFLTASKHSIDGLKIALQQEKNVRIEISLAICAILIGFFVKLNSIEWLILCLTVAMVLCTELINTVIEKMLDLYTEEYNETIKQAKDIASGAVFVTSIVAVIIGCILFLPKIGRILI